MGPCVHSSRAKAHRLGEPAAGGPGAGRRDPARQGRQPGAFGGQARVGGEQRGGVGEPGSGEQGVHVGPFDDLAGVHDDGPVGDVGDDAPVVGDQQDGHAGAAAAARAAAAGSRPAR